MSVWNKEIKQNAFEVSKIFESKTYILQVIEINEIRKNLLLGFHNGIKNQNAFIEKFIRPPDNQFLQKNLKIP